MHKFYQLPSEIVRAYDIRGVFGENLNQTDAYHIGLKIIAMLRDINPSKRPKICIGRDGRLSSDNLHHALLDGLKAGGATVIDLGVVPTPALYFANYHLPEIDAAIMITGSHNPPQYNGFKMMIGHTCVCGDDLKQLAAYPYDLLENDNWLYNQYDISDDYIAVIGALAPNIRPFKVIWDPGHGSSCLLLQKLIAQLPGEHIVINGTIDGNFPAHAPDPSVAANLQQLVKSVKDSGADFGIAFDGDADRIGMVTASGQILFGSHLILILAHELLLRKPGTKIITDSKMSDVVLSKIAEWGGQSIPYRTGHAFIKAKMREEGALLAGEMSGHLFFAEDYYGFDDGVLAACKILNIISMRPEIVEMAIQAMSQVVSLEEIKIYCQEHEKERFMNAVKSFFVNQDIEYNSIDGIKVKLEHGWCLIRASNTESVIMAVGEVNHHDHRESLEKLMHDALKAGNCFT